MENIGSWWLAKVPVNPDEIIEWSCLANRTQKSDRAVGGKLWLTNQRLVFTPHLFDYVLAGERWAVPLDYVVQIDKQPKGGDYYGGGLRDRLRIVLSDNTVELFVINNLDQVIEHLNGYLRS